MAKKKYSCALEDSCRKKKDKNKRVFIIIFGEIENVKQIYTKTLKV